MQPDDELCLCFHVTKRKVQNFLRVEKPRRVGQLSECFGAGTGCGWCRPFLQRLFEQAQSGMLDTAGTLGSAAAGAQEPTPDSYAAERAKYLQETGAKPPGSA
jgi:NAD(P)H-nitrite reductase large subunit